MNNNDTKFSGEAQDANTPIGEYIFWVALMFLAIIFLGCLAFMWYYFSNTTRGADYCRKDDLKKEIKAKISNGANLEVVEDVFADRHKHSTSTREWDYRLEKDYYDNNTTLLQVLRDLRADYFDSIPYTVPPTTRDTAFYYRLRMIIDEYMRKTPFDGLEKGQQELFVNLQTSLGDNYEAVKGKITDIAKEINSKNALVEKYLNKSNDSYVLSLIALIATCVFGVATIIFGYLGLKNNRPR